MFADTLFNQAGRAGVLSNNANENNIARDREDNRRRFEQEPEDAFDASHEWVDDDGNTWKVPSLVDDNERTCPLIWPYVPFFSLRYAISR